MLKVYLQTKENKGKTEIRNKAYEWTIINDWNADRIRLSNR